MLPINARVGRQSIPTIAVYLAVISAVVSVNAWRISAESEKSAPQNTDGYFSTASAETNPAAKPFFSLTTNRTYGPDERARLWLNYQGVEQLDFRVYRLKDPVKFFKQLSNPHQVGEEEKQEVAASYRRTPTLLERTRAFKNWVYGSIKDYVRSQLNRELRKSFNQKFRADNRETRTPLNVADYARMPLLNPDQLISSWREKLPPLEDVYDRRMIPLGKREPGVYLIEAVSGDLQRAYSVAVVTDLAMVQKTTPGGDILVYAVDRKTGAPREGARIEVVKGSRTLASGTTGTGGILKTTIRDGQSGGPVEPQRAVEDAEGAGDEGPQGESFLIMAEHRDNFAISDLDSFYFSEFAGEEGTSGASLTGYVYTDRPIYRPAQKVYFKGILRQLGPEGYRLPLTGTVNVVVQDPNGGKVFEGDLTLSTRGTFSGEVDIAAEAPLGNYQVIANVGEATSNGYFEVQEYKKPEYKVKVSAPKRFIPVGEKTKFSVEARYFFGSPVADAEVKYYIYRSRHYHWWWGGDEDVDDGIDEEAGDEESGYYGYSDEMVQEGEGVLDARGRMSVEFEVPQPSEEEIWDYSYRLEAQVTDASRRTIEGRATVTGTRGSTVAYATPTRYVYFQGDTARVQVKTGNYEGRPVAARVTLKFIEQRWEKIKRKTESGYEYDDYEERLRELSMAEVNTNAQGEAVYDYNVPTPGNIRIKTIVHEGEKEIVSGGGYLWVADRKSEWSNYAYQDYGSIKLIPDKKSYRPGETAHVLAMLPTDGAHLLVTTELMSVMTARHVNAPGRAVIIDVPIEARYAPNVFLNVTYVRDNDMYSNDQMLAVPARDKMLSLEIVPNKKEYKPRETASYTILARNSDGSPAAGAELSLGVVDEAIYSIQPETAGNIRREFYGRRYNQVQTNFSVSHTFTGYSGEIPVSLALKNKPSYQLADFKNENELAEPTIRKRFKDTAFWQPDVVTGADGRATVKVRLPDNLTTWRATVRAVTADTRVGSAVGKVIARKDLILRVETPRFLTEGDTVTVSAVVHNFLQADKETRISVEVSGAELLSPARETVTIRRNGQHRIDWQVAATRLGEIKLLAKALTDTESDAVETTLEALPGGLRQSSGQALTLSENSVEKSFSLDLPANASIEARTLRLEASTSIAGSLFGALDYLTGFPYGCTEQTMSRFLPNVIVSQTLQEVRTARVSETNDLGPKVQRGLERLYNFQHGDGGWGWWKNDETDPFMTAYVVDGLMMASRAGYQVDVSRIERGRARLTEMIEAGETVNSRPIDEETRAYMIYALNESGAVEARHVNELFARRAGLQPYGRALLALTLKARGDSRAVAVAHEIERTARANDRDAYWESRRQPMLDFSESSSLEATALSLKALARIAPESPLLPKAARWLVTNRQYGDHWLSTKHTAFAIFGLTDYLKVSKELSPDYTVEVYLNGERVLERRVGAAEASSGQRFIIGRKGRMVSGANHVRVVKRGRGVFYLSANLDYFTNDREVTAQASPELSITREYFRLHVVEDGGKSKWSLEPLTGEIRSGDLIVTRLRIRGGKAQYLMVEDPIPAGCEQVERVSGINFNYSENGWGDWYSSREFRDQKTVFFLNQFDGDATFQYALRVQVPGEFRIAPARAERMYQPDVEANTATGKMSILERR